MPFLQLNFVLQSRLPPAIKVFAASGSHRDEVALVFGPNIFSESVERSMEHTLNSVVSITGSKMADIKGWKKKVAATRVFETSAVGVITLEQEIPEIRKRSVSSCGFTVNSKNLLEGRGVACEVAYGWVLLEHF